LTLIQTKKIRDFPVVLFGSSYWTGLLSWVREVVLPQGKISEHDLRLFHITDSPAEIVQIVIRSQSSLSHDKLVSDEIRITS
ncbi:MAG TPA: LOG family protein, partial [Pyrinomonadaceae bacterium]|nr:LOG family protein [Pyrinomonadaceae bacterium]